MSLDGVSHPVFWLAGAIDILKQRLSTMYDLPGVDRVRVVWLEELAQQQLKGCVIWGEKFRHEGKRSIVIAIVFICSSFVDRRAILFEGFANELLALSYGN